MPKSSFEQLMGVLRENPELYKSTTGIFKAVLWLAHGTVAGGIVYGPEGALIGGMVGSVIGFITSNEYQPMMKVLQGMDQEERDELLRKVHALVNDDSEDALAKFVLSEENRMSLLELLSAATQRQ
ncbi:unnamed protein product [Lymnaea stagnalis]|uniref:Uncharacterized protein n=1 Tax=Lymnaea stagnalis TaxID=6523 RepID=A0AAV2HRV3_LYMST